jgi:integrase
MNQEWPSQFRSNVNRKHPPYPKRSKDSPGDWDRVTPNPKAKLLDQVREVMRIKNYSLRTERSYCDWIKRYVRFHQMRSREELESGEPKVEAFLSNMAVVGNVAASTRNQAFNALIFLYREVLGRPLEHVQALRADRPARVSVALTRDEVRQVLGAMTGLPLMVVKLFYGSGLRLMEALRLRVQ